MPKVFDAIPILGTTDLAATIDFFVNTLGGTEPWTIDQEGTAYYGGASLSGKPVHFSAIGAGSDRMQMYFHIEDVDTWAAELLRRGVNSAVAEDRPYGMRDFRVAAPGHVIVGFGSDLPR